VKKKPKTTLEKLEALRNFNSERGKRVLEATNKIQAEKANNEAVINLEWKNNTRKLRDIYYRIGHQNALQNKFGVALISSWLFTVPCVFFTLIPPIKIMFAFFLFPSITMFLHVIVRKLGKEIKRLEAEYYQVNMYQDELKKKAESQKVILHFYRWEDL
jgi:uncharacterized protein YacL